MTMTDLFEEFARLKLAADGSDSYIMGAVHQAGHEEDPFFYAAVFTTFYAPPTQDVFCKHWTRRDVLERPKTVMDWVEHHWKELPMSGARRTGAFTPIKVVKAIRGAAELLTWENLEPLHGLSFDEAFRAIRDAVPYHGRYTGLKLYETLRRIGAPLPVVDNIVPKGGRTPRKGLAAIYPQHDYHDDSPYACFQANDLAGALADRIGTTWFNVEMLLCNFTKAVKGGYYPGHALDRDLSRIFKIEETWGHGVTRAIRAGRTFLYPTQCLGELNGWVGTEKRLERCYPDNGYLWSDLRYHRDEVIDFANPSRRELPLTPVIGYGEERV